MLTKEPEISHLGLTATGTRHDVVNVAHGRGRPTDRHLGLEEHNGLAAQHTVVTVAVKHSLPEIVGDVAATLPDDRYTIGLDEELGL